MNRTSPHMKPIRIWICHELDTESERIKREICEQATKQRIKFEFVDTFTESDFAIFHRNTLHIPLKEKFIFFTEPPDQEVQTFYVISNLKEIAKIVIQTLSMYRAFDLLQKNSN